MRGVGAQRASRERMRTIILSNQYVICVCLCTSLVRKHVLYVTVYMSKETTDYRPEKIYRAKLLDKEPVSSYNWLPRRVTEDGNDVI